MVLISWLGFQQKHIPGIREKRTAGKSSFTLPKQFKLFLDTVIYFSYQPLRWISYLGIFSAFASFCYVIFIFFNTIIFGNAVEGWSSLMIIQLLFNGIILIMLGVLGEYLWRTLEQGRERPLFLIDYIIEKGEILKYELPQE